MANGQTTYRRPASRCVTHRGLALRVLFFQKGKDDEYNEKKLKEVVPTVNKIFIIQKDGGIDDAIDRFVPL